MSEEKEKKRKKSALEKVWTFFGMSKDDSEMQEWKEKCEDRAQVLLQFFFI